LAECTDTVAKLFFFINLHFLLDRYRSILKRLEGVEDKWMKNSLVVALGGFTTKTR
jgi:hypothetical protein